MHFTRAQDGAAKAAGSKIAAALLGFCCLAVAGCNGEDGGSGSANIVQPAGAQEAPAAGTTPLPGAAAPAPVAAAAGEAAKAPPAEGKVDVAVLMAEGPLPDVVIGDPKAPVTIVEYASMTCSHCADFHENTLPVIKKAYLDTGKAKLILREFPFDPRALAAFMLARCAPEGKRTAMVDVLFSQQESWARAENASEALLSISKLAGFSQESFTACLSDKELQRKVVETQQRGEKEFGVAATPTFFVNGNKYAGALPPAEMAAVIDAQL